MLIFLEKVEDEQLITEIKAACAEVRLAVGTCFNEEQLATFGKDAGAKSKGVYLFPKKFGRGIDFKLKIDAKVLILMNGEHKLTTADCNQLAGRGNRSQAIPSALLIMIKPTYDVDALAIVQTNDEAGEINQVPDNVKRLYDRWPSLAKEKPDKRASIAEKLTGEGWMREEWPLTNDERNWLHGVRGSSKNDKKKNNKN